MTTIEMHADMWWALPLTVGVFMVARALAARWRKPVFNPLLMALLVIIPLLYLFQIPYQRYFAASRVLHELLQAGVVALAFPLYRQLPAIIRRWKLMLGVCCTASLVAMVSGVVLAHALGASREMTASVLTKSVTTPIALAISREVGGIGAVTAMCVLVVGILGAVFAYAILNRLGIRAKSARGMAIGASAHVIGTAQALDTDREEGAFSSLALVLCGVVTALTAPTLFSWLMTLL